MNERETRALVASYVEKIWNGADLDALEDLTTPEYTYRLGGHPPRDIDAMRQFLDELRTAFPDWTVEIESIVADGGVVAIRWTGSATHAGAFRGIPPSGQSVVVGGMNFYELDRGLIAREWEQMDSLGLLEQLGVLDER